MTRLPDFRPLAFALTALSLLAQAPSPQEQAALEACMKPLPTGGQVAVAVVRGTEVRFLGMEKASSGLRPVDNRGGVFELGSISKVFTATLFARQVTQRHLDLHAPVQAQVPFPLKVRGREGADMELWHLATHTSGIEHHQPPGAMTHAFFHGHLDQPWKDWDRARFEQYLKEDLALAHKPGTRYRYSNMGMSLLGYIVSLRAGTTYEALLQAELCQPLGMTTTGTDPTRMLDRVVVGLKANGKPFPGQDMAALAPCGGIYSSAQDLARFALYHLDPAHADAALTQRIAFKDAEQGSLGLGWHTLEFPDGSYWLNHNGNIAGYNNSFNLNPKTGCAVIVLCNVVDDPAPGEAVRKLGRTLMRLAEAP